MVSGKERRVRLVSWLRYKKRGMAKGVEVELLAEFSISHVPDFLAWASGKDHKSKFSS